MSLYLCCGVVGALTVIINDVVGVTGSVVLVSYLFLLLWRMSTHRKEGLSAAEVVLAGPLPFLRPERYFPVEKLSTPWRYFTWWFVGASLLLIVTYKISEAVESRVAI